MPPQLEVDKVGLEFVVAIKKYLEPEFKALSDKLEDIDTNINKWIDELYKRITKAEEVLIKVGERQVGTKHCDELRSDCRKEVAAGVEKTIKENESLKWICRVRKNFTWVLITLSTAALISIVRFLFYVFSLHPFNP
ncbi:MAG: hypothetical protein ABIJ08_05335 [Nanoarchaeota archaeon]